MATRPQTFWTWARPSRPCGRTSSTTASATNGTASFHDDPLTVQSQKPDAEREAGDDRLQHAEQEAAEHRAGDVAEAADDDHGQPDEGVLRSHVGAGHAEVGADHRPGDRSQAAAQDEREQDQPVRRDAEQARGLRVLRDRLQRLARAGPVEQEPQPRHHRHRDHERQDARGLQHDAADLEGGAGAGQRIGRAQRIGADEVLDQVREHQGHAEARHQRQQGVGAAVAQRPERQALDEEVERAGEQRAQHERDPEVSPNGKRELLNGKFPPPNWRPSRP